MKTIEFARLNVRLLSAADLQQIQGGANSLLPLDVPPGPPVDIVKWFERLYGPKP